MEMKQGPIRKGSALEMPKERPAVFEEKGGMTIQDPEEWRTDWKSIYIVTLVAFVSEVHRHSTAIWPYLKQLDPTATESFNGLLRSTSGSGILISALTAGYVSNKLKDTKWAMIFAKTLAICSCLLFLCIELLKDGRKWAFLAFEFFFGLSIGSANIYKAHVAMASTEADRPRAVGICSLAPGIGFIAGPAISNGILNSSDSKSTIDSTVGSTAVLDEPLSKFDCVAVVVCLFTKAAATITIINFATLGSPYTMTVFQWDSSEAVKYQAIILALVGMHVIAWNLGYIFLNLRERLSERKGIVIALFILLTAYIITYPWPFLANKIAYEHEKSPTSGPNDQKVGCPKDYAWCATTPAVNMYIFLGSIIVTLGMAVPLVQINLDILFSKVLGKMKQGTMQGVFIACGDGLNIILPIIISEVYVLTGPTHIWEAIMVMLSLCLCLWFVFYKRMISNTRRMENYRIRPKKPSQIQWISQEISSFVERSFDEDPSQLERKESLGGPDTTADRTISQNIIQASLALDSKMAY
ncbi:major facilitator superfamily domain-containing protein [Ditylenchus destructor]|uniref:Major facilitator superfamily domain-containing protein n=1 Tax=Ditylenchus destructor TaxID=166010 RepID=A0AAD4R285_9BILA|nr:major facilitator superfamily domain-containing protein [Ditylenchus destructor]